MLELVVRVRPKHYETRSLADGLSRDSFWKWDDFLSYCVFLAGFTSLVGTLAVAFVDSIFFVELLGFAALATEAMLGVPQLLRNRRTRSVAGLSKVLIGSWCFGDAFKVVYFSMSGAPLQFILCGLTQLGVDFAIVYQFYAYGGKHLE